MNWYLKVLQNYFVFSGRARRKEYWYFTLVNLIIMLLLVVLDLMINLFSETYGLGLTSGIYSLVVLIPSIAVLVRRLHDTNRSAWWLLIAIIPLIGTLVLLVLTIFDSDDGSNRYGPNPK